MTESQATRKFPLLEDERVLNHGVLAPPTTAEVLFGRFATSAVQTDFRESETQTQPWTPPYVTHGETPEVLYLERLTGSESDCDTPYVQLLNFSTAKFIFFVL